ncbi:hypothetical protein V9T40_007492 [Parthenolecanium corni]|uniref:Uncharacterized protein n=1 Tax=Parthenolecanium corni TaxID=536013 RepID=A0AAN9TH59_9HEMI
MAWWLSVDALGYVMQPTAVDTASLMNISCVVFVVVVVVEMMAEAPGGCILKSHYVFESVVNSAHANFPRDERRRGDNDDDDDDDDYNRV